MGRLPSEGAEQRTRDRARRRTAWALRILLGVAAGAEALLLAACTAAFGLPAGVAIAIFVLAQAVIAIRIAYIPRPDPPPPWFEQLAVRGVFVFATTSLVAVPVTVAVVAGLLGPAPAAAAMAIATAVGLHACGIPRRRVVVRRVSVTLPGLERRLRAVHLTDLHAGVFTSRADLERWVRLANRQEPDLVLLTGDLVAFGPRYVPDVEAALAKLRAPLGVYSVLGNHDRYGVGTEEAIRAMHRRLGIRLVEGAWEAVPGGLVVAGLGDRWTGEEDVARAIAGAPPGRPVLLLVHDPTVFPAAARQGVALQVSGHVHGGQLAIPGLGARGSVLRLLGVPWVAGLYRIGASQLWLGAGLGTTGAPVRLGVPAELPVLDLEVQNPPPG